MSEKIRKWKDVLPCTCDKTYKQRGLTSPECVRCNYLDDVIACHDSVLDEIVILAKERQSLMRGFNCIGFDDLQAIIEKVSCKQ